MELFRAVLFVKDMEHMSRFYSEALAMTPTGEASEDWQVLASGSVELALHGIPAPWRDEIVISDPPEVREGAPTKLVFYVPDLDTAEAQLVNAGAVMLGGGNANPADGPVIRLDFADPEGNVLQVTSSRND